MEEQPSKRQKVGPVHAMEALRWQGLMDRAKNALAHYRNRIGDEDEDGEYKDEEESDTNEIYCEACRLGYLPVVKFLLDGGLKVDPENEGFVPLYEAAHHGHLDIVKFLLERGAPVNSKTKGGITSLHAASHRGHMDVVKLLVDSGAEIYLVDENNFSALHLAATRGHLEVVKLLVEKGGEDRIRKDSTPLIEACRGGYIDVVKFFLDRTDHIEFVDNYDTPLSAAASNGHLEPVRETTPFYINLALLVASQNGHAEIAKLLLEKGARAVSTGASYYPLASAAAEGHLPVVQLLLDNGALVDAETKHKFTALHCASERGKLDVAKLLMEWGAQIDLMSDEGAPLFLAAREGHSTIVEELVSRGADFLQPNKDGCTPLQAAARGGYCKVVKVLLEKGADPNSKTRHGFTALHHAAVNYDSVVVELLLDNGALINATTDNGSTPLLLACAKNRLPVVKALLGRGASVVLADKLGFTPMKNAVSHNKDNLVEFLVHHMVMHNEIDVEGCKAAFVHLTSMASNLDTCIQLLKALPQLAVEVPQALYSVADAKYCKSTLVLDFMKLLIENGAPLDWTHSFQQETALHKATGAKEPSRVWLLTLHGADTSIMCVPDPFLYHFRESPKSVCGDDKDTRDALLHFWTTQTHKIHPVWVREAVISVLLIAKRQRWPFDQLLLQKILSHVAFGWYKKPNG